MNAFDAAVTQQRPRAFRREEAQQRPRPRLPVPGGADIDSAVRAGRRQRPSAVLSPLAAVVVVAAVVLGACASPGSGPQPPGAAPTTHAAASPAADLGSPVLAAAELLGVWSTVRLDGQDVSRVRDLDGQPLFVRFGEDQTGPWWAANDGCNQTSGRYTTGQAGRFSAEAAVVTARGCIHGSEYPQNPAAVPAADEARIVGATDAEPRRLILIGQGQVIADYAFQPEAAAP